MNNLPLHDLHAGQNGQFIICGEWNLPGHYGDAAREYQAMIDSVGLVDLSYLGKLRVTGKDALDLLNRISTNDLNGLMLGNICETVFTTPKGRIVDYCRVARFDEGLIVVSSHDSPHHLEEWIERFIILEDVQVEEAGERCIWLTLLGPRAVNLLGILNPAFDLREMEQLSTQWQGEHLSIFRNNQYIVPAFDICLSAQGGESFIPALLDKSETIGLSLVGQQAYQAMRIESAVPAWGSELTEDYNPHEARLQNALSFTKGCYTGQEVIARLDTYDKVQKYLMIVEVSENLSIHPPADLFMEDEIIGKLTSICDHPVHRKPFGLGYISKHFAIEDFQVQAELRSQQHRVVATLRIPPKKLT